MFDFWSSAARYAPIVTASVACLALVVAFISIVSQRKIARQRAAVDFFLKFEMDEKMVKADEAFEEAVKELRKSTAVQEFAATDHCKKVRAFLVILELMAVGIHDKAFDRRICYEFWADVFGRAHNDTRRLIDHIRTEPGLHCDVR